MHPKSAVVVCEDQGQHTKQVNATVAHPIIRLRFHRALSRHIHRPRVRRVLQTLSIPLLVLYGLWCVFRYRPTRILTLYMNASWLVSSYILSVICRIPIVYYVHDAFVVGLTRRWEARILRHGQVIVLHPMLGVLYRDRYGIDATTVPHINTHHRITGSSTGSSSMRNHQTGTVAREKSAEHVATIGFAGCIYNNNAALLRQFADVCAEQHLDLVLYSDLTPQRMQALHLTHACITHRYEPDYATLLHHLSQCDLLYLPLAFPDGNDEAIAAMRYAFPTKSIDYLLAGPPILVQAPPDYAVSQFFSRSRSAFMLMTDDRVATSAWLQHWQQGEYTAPAESVMQHALMTFDRHTNLAALRGVLGPGFFTHAGS